jgi:2-polyprenyl-6-hydroxyphenyl methylase/3-demethylubiquinone-9 3-methyltransferase
MPVTRFDFGINWKNYSAHALDAGRFEAARESLKLLLGAESLAGLTVLDVGCGSGIFSIAAKQMGAAAVLGIDISREAIATSVRNAEAFGETSGLEFREGDILDPAFADGLGEYDRVYAWGSLHHTGQMWHALAIAAAKVARHGDLVLAIYNKHWTSPLWRHIKRVYNTVPGFLKSAMVGGFYPLIYVSKLVILRVNPRKMKRGMDFYYDVVDWIGGYPYEYASVSQISRFVESKGFRLLKVNRAHLPTGNNEYVFRRI